MSDIVERLRADKTRYADEMSINAQNLCHEAANEIERLRRRLSAEILGAVIDAELSDALTVGQVRNLRDKILEAQKL